MFYNTNPLIVKKEVLPSLNLFLSSRWKNWDCKLRVRQCDWSKKIHFQNLRTKLSFLTNHMLVLSVFASCTTDQYLQNLFIKLAVNRQKFLNLFSVPAVLPCNIGAGNSNSDANLVLTIKAPISVTWFDFSGIRERYWKEFQYKCRVTQSWLLQLPGHS